jgi:hypothetical protein
VSVISGFFGLEEERNRVRRDKYRGSMHAGILLGGINIGDAESSKKKKKKKKEVTLHVSSNRQHIFRTLRTRSILRG